MIKFYIALACTVILPFLVLLFDIRHKKAVRLTLSHFWYFTIIFLTAFPLRAWLLHADAVKPQVASIASALPRTDEFLANALFISLLFWCAAYIGYRITKTHSEEPLLPNKNPSSSQGTHQLIASYLFFMMLAVGAILYLNPSADMLHATVANTLRKGAGVVWILPELFVVSFIVFVCALTFQRTNGIAISVKLLLALGVALSLWVSIELLTRRTFAAVILTFVIVIVLFRNRLWPIALISVIGTVFASPLFEFIRKFGFYWENSGDFFYTLSNTFNAVVTNFLNYLSTGFEGVEHTGQMVAKATWGQLLTGFDYGVSWFFNLGLSLFPRFIWEGKPVVYGGFSEFRWLYPDAFNGDHATLAIPPSLIVDFSFGFGIPAGLVLAFFLGRFFAVCQYRLWNPLGNPAVLAISLYTFIFMFNIVRSGTIHGQSLLLLGLVCIVMLGPRVTVQGFVLMVKETFDIRFIRG